MNRNSSLRGTTTIARAADSENRKVNGSTPSGIQVRAPVSARIAISASASPTPPSATSWAAVSIPSRDPATRISASTRSACRSTVGGMPVSKPCNVATADPPNSGLVCPSR